MKVLSLEASGSARTSDSSASRFPYVMLCVSLVCLPPAEWHSRFLLFFRMLAGASFSAGGSSSIPCSPRMNASCQNPGGVGLCL